MLHHLEAWLTNLLLRSPAFHRAIRAVHKKVHEAQHGKDPAELGGTNVEGPSSGQLQKFINNYRDEIKEQFWGARKR